MIDVGLSNYAFVVVNEVLTGSIHYWESIRL